MPAREAIDRAREDARQGKAPSTQAGEFVREEIDHIREGKHGARSPQQAIAIGLSEARRAGVDLPPAKRGRVTDRSRQEEERAYEAGQKGPYREPSPRRSRATTKALDREGRSAASHSELSKQAHSAATRRSAAERSAAAKRGAKTKAAAKRSASARKAARTRSRHRP
jgi:hypothetical protein